MDAFDDIRPYTDAEMTAAMRRIAENEYFPSLAGFIFPDVPVTAVRDRVLSYRTVREFQHDAMYEFNRQIISGSTDGVVCEGMDRLRPGEPCLFVSNHRDIMLDSCLLQYLLVMAGLETTQITFGANLMMSQLIVDIGRSNKMFKVERPGGGIREFYNSSRRLSAYIRQVLEEGESVWIAQRNGRTKDGVDATDQGIIKMFCLSVEGDGVAALSGLHIVPVAVSYEWEPCDGAKTAELFKSRSCKYEKAPGEDLRSILSGILTPKGRVTFRICEPLSYSDIASCRAGHAADGDFHKAVAALIDSRILQAYRLYPNNFIASDILAGTAAYVSTYTEEQKTAFLRHEEQVLGGLEGPREELESIFLGIYANPVASLRGCLAGRMRSVLEEAVPLVDLDSEFLFAELDSLGIMSILLALSNEFGIELGAADVIPRNFMNLDSLVTMVIKKLAQK